MTSLTKMKYRNGMKQGKYLLFLKEQRLEKMGALVAYLRGIATAKYSNELAEYNMGCIDGEAHVALRALEIIGVGVRR